MRIRRMASAAAAKVRIFAGLSVDEAGAALGLPHTSAYRQWTYAQAWLRAKLRDPSRNPWVQILGISWRCFALFIEGVF